MLAWEALLRPRDAGVLHTERPGWNCVLFLMGRGQVSRWLEQSGREAETLPCQGAGS